MVIQGEKMTTFGTKRTLEAAEKAMNIHPDNSQSEESRDFFIRCGMSEHTGNDLLPNDIRILSQVMNGIYPATMTGDDVEQIHQINEAFEEACQQ